LADVFISYSRKDTLFVQRLASSLEGMGKTSWIDTERIADAEVFPQAIRSAIQASDAFLFVITPASLASSYCDQEVTYARALEKRIVPVMHIAVPDEDLHDEIRQRNWIPLTEEDDFDSSLERVVRALDTDLVLRKEHTRWLIKCMEWDGENRDRSFLLRGSELKAAEAWLTRSSREPDPAPTALQLEYMAASRKANASRSRRVVAISLALAVVAIGLGIVALLSRNQAVSSGNTARSQALAAESQNELTSDPEVSIILAQKAVRLAPIPAAVGALRQALDTSEVRMALPPESGKQCGFESGPATAFSPSGGDVAESLCTGDIVVANAASGHLLYRRHVADQASAVAYSPTGSILAVGTNTGIDLLDPSTGRLLSTLSGHGEPNALDFSPNGYLLAATTNLGTSVWDLASGTTMFSFVDHDNDRTVAFTSDGTSLVVGTGSGYAQVVDVATGVIVRTVVPPAAQEVLVAPRTPDPVAIEGNTLVVGVNTTGPLDTSGDVDLFNTQTWGLTSVEDKTSGASITAVALSPNQNYIAVGLDDGTGGVWAQSGDNELFSLEGQGAQINTLSFNSDGNRVVDADNEGFARIYRSGTPWLTSLPQVPHWCDHGFGSQPGKLLGLTQSGEAITLQTWSVPGFRPTSKIVVVPSNQENVCSALSPDGRLVALWYGNNPTSSVGVYNVAARRVELTLPSMPVEGVSFSNDDRLMTVANGDGGLLVTTLSTHHTVSSGGWPHQCPLTGDGPPIISSDDRLVAAYSLCGKVTVGRTSDAKPFETYDEHGPVETAAFDPDASELAIGSLDGSVTVVDVASDQRVLALLGHSRQVTGLAYSPQGRYMAASSYDDTIRVWDAATGQTLQVDDDFSFTFAPYITSDGKYLIEGNNDDQTNVWSACPDCDDPGALLKASRAEVVSPLTPREQAQVAASS
jgi:WD40 repeat protein